MEPIFPRQNNIPAIPSAVYTYTAVAISGEPVEQLLKIEVHSKEDPVRTIFISFLKKTIRIMDDTLKSVSRKYPALVEP